VAVPAEPRSLSELAAELGGELLSGGDTLIQGVASLDDAESGDLSFARSPAYQSALTASRASAFIIGPDLDPGGRPAIRAADPSDTFARAVALLVPPERPAAGRHPSASVEPSAEVDATASLGAGVSVGAGSRVGARTVVHANVSIYPGVEVGEDCELHAGVVLREGTCLGDRVRLQPGVILGGDGFGFLPSAGAAARRVPQVGRVVIEDDVEIGAGSTVDRAALGETRIRRGAKIDNLVMIAHNCDIGEDAIIVAQSGLAGGTRVGARAILMARVGAAGQLEIGEGAIVGARAGLHRDVPAGGQVWGSPAVERRAWHREVIALRRLPELLKRLQRVERRLDRESTDPGGEERER
jgi:UDP-3-O-[3-hydroxymyristoyl] glucosamine N-acyltransferase